jgi:hypothetical protein
MKKLIFLALLAVSMFAANTGTTTKAENPIPLCDGC